MLKKITTPNTVMTVAGRRRRDFSNQSTVRTHAQSPPDYGSRLRPKTLYGEMQIATNDNTAHRSAPVDTVTLPRRFRRSRSHYWPNRPIEVSREYRSHEPAPFTAEPREPSLTYRPVARNETARNHRTPLRRWTAIPTSKVFMVQSSNQFLMRSCYPASSTQSNDDRRSLDHASPILAPRNPSRKLQLLLSTSSRTR